MRSSWPTSDPGARGFTLLECEVAIIVLVLLTYGVLRMVGSHEVLISDMEGVATDDSTWYVSQPADELARWMGQPATAGADPVASSFGGNGGGSPSDTYELDVLDASYELAPLSASARIELTEL